MKKKQRYIKELCESCMMYEESQIQDGNYIIKEGKCPRCKRKHQVAVIE